MLRAEKRKVIEGRVSITRPQGGREPEVIKISIEDVRAAAGFCVVELPLADFARAVTGHVVRGEVTVAGLERVGKKMEHRPFSFPLNRSAALVYGEDREKVACEAIKQHLPEGWQSDDYFRSQDSFYTTEDGKLWARTTIRRWVDDD